MVKFKVGDFVSIVKNQIPHFKKYSGYVGEIKQIGGQYIIKLEQKHDKDGRTYQGLPITKNVPVLINDSSSPYHGKNGIVKHKQGNGLYQLEMLGGARERKIFHQDKFKILYNEIKVNASLVSVLLRKEMVGGATSSTDIENNELCGVICSQKSSSDSDTRRTKCTRNVIYGPTSHQTDVSSRRCYIHKKFKKPTCCEQYRTLNCDKICDRNNSFPLNNPSQLGNDPDGQPDSDNRLCFLSNKHDAAQTDITSCQDFKSKIYDTKLDSLPDQSKKAGFFPTRYIPPKPSIEEIPTKEEKTPDEGKSKENPEQIKKKKKISDLKKIISDLNVIKSGANNYTTCHELDKPENKDKSPLSFVSTGFFTQTRKCLQNIKQDSNRPQGYRRENSDLKKYRESKKKGSPEFSKQYPTKSEIINNLDSIITQKTQELSQMENNDNSQQVPTSLPSQLSVSPGVILPSEQEPLTPPGLPPRPEPKPDIILSPRQLNFY